jgi:hypothetical protein
MKLEADQVGHGVNRNNSNMRISIALQTGISKSKLATMGTRKDNGGQLLLTVPHTVALGSYSNNQNVALEWRTD